MLGLLCSLVSIATLSFFLQELKPLDIFFAKIYSKLLKCVDEFPDKKKEEIKKEHTSVSLLSIRRCIVYFDFP